MKRIYLSITPHSGHCHDDTNDQTEGCMFWQRETGYCFVYQHAKDAGQLSCRLIFQSPSLRNYGNVPGKLKIFLP